MSTAAKAIAAVPVHIVGGRLRDDLRAVGIVWRRELVRFLRSRARSLTVLAMPLIFLFILGGGLSSTIAPGQHGIDFKTFMFPGMLAMTVLFTAISSSVTIVWDREFGFLREMLVAPVRRGAVIFGKAAGGATVATIQGLMVLALAGLVDVPYSFTMLATLAGEMVLLSFAATAFGALMASRMQQVESFQLVMQLFVMPMFFLSGAVAPVTRLPSWLRVVSMVDPLTYAVDAMRRAVFGGIGSSTASESALAPGITWGGWPLPILLELAIVAVLGAAMLSVAISRFAKIE